MDLLLLGDQTTDYLPTLRKLLRRNRSPYFSIFLEEATALIQNEVLILPKHKNINFPPFSTMEELVDRYEFSDKRNAVLDSTLACLAQIAHFVMFLERRQVKKEHQPEFRVVGVCTGLLAAAAAASCESLETFIPLALETIRVAFRVGFLVATRAEELIQDSSDQLWSTVIARHINDDPDIEITSLNEKLNLKHGRKLYISSIGPSTITISGPPSSLDLRSKQLSPQNQAIPIRGPYHAPHIFSEKDLAQLIPDASCYVLKSYQVESSKTSFMGDLESTSTLELFRHCIYRILRAPVIWTRLLDDCAKFTDLDFKLIPVGSSTMLNSMIALLRKEFPGSEVQSDELEEGQSLCEDTSDHSKIAIVGMSGRFPGADDNDEFWSILEKGIDTHRTIPPDRWDFKSHTDESGKGKNKSHTPYGCFINDAGNFDNQFFNISPREAAQMDPMQRLALVTAYEAMESSGMVLNRTPSTQADRVATFYGQAIDDWKETNTAQDIDTFFITGGIRAFGPGRINYHFGFQGPSYNVDTACSSSLAAIQLACTSLKARECDTVLAGGMNIFTNPDIFAGLSKGHFLSKTGPCKTSDEGADGYCRGEGVGTVILKRLPDALQDRDHILGVIVASATNHSAEAISITHPHIETQEALFKKVLQNARLDAHDINYIEMHGTGTVAGDTVEMESVTRVFAPTGRRQRKDNNPLYLGSLKPNIGHGEAVSGFSSLVKVLSMFQRDTIPPHCGISTQLNRGFPTDLAARNVRIASTSTSWPRSATTRRRVLLDNFGAAGGNSSLIIEDRAVLGVLGEDPRTRHIIAISAKSITALATNIEKLIKHIKANPEIDLPNLSYTTTARRMHYRYRALPALAPPRINFVFTGQGCQYVGMGQLLFQTSRTFKDQICRLDVIAVSQGFPSFAAYIANPEEHASGESIPASKLSMISQLALVCLQISLARLWISWGVQPSAVIGHSLGEYAALNIAGVLSDHDTVYLVGSRSQLMKKHCQTGTHSMLAVRADSDRELNETRTIASHHNVEISCINSPRDIVFSGTQLAVDAVKKTLPSKVKSQKVDVPYAFHSAQVEPILDEFEALASSVVFSKPKIAIISSLYSKFVDEGHSFGARYFRDHCRKTVNFADALQSQLKAQRSNDHSRTVWLEIGPHPTCCTMIKATLQAGHETLCSLTKTNGPWTSLAQSCSKLYIEGLKLDWMQYHREFEQSLALVPLPAYSFDNKKFWIDYVNNWSLNKGEIRSSALTTADSLELSTTTVQNVLQQDFNKNDGTATILAETDFADSFMQEAVAGHLINGVALCPSAIYADMAMTICNHGYRILCPVVAKFSMDIRDMANTKPLVVDISKTSKIGQKVEIEARIDLSTRSAKVSIRSRSTQKVVEHASCMVVFRDDPQQANEWNRVEHLINSRLDVLTCSPNVNKIQGGMAYKLFSNLVQYGPKYRGMSNVLLDSDCWEATAQVSCRSTKDDGSYFFSPYLIDNLAHISGFVMNANEALEADHVYISQGWSSMRLSDDISLGRNYQVYVKMQPQHGSKMVAGDVYVLCDTKIVGLIEGCRFQSVPRTLLNTLLPTQQNSSQASFLSSVTLGEGVTESQMAPSPSWPSKLVEGAKTFSHRAMSIVAGEIGCGVDELHDTALFSDLGVDSLLSLTILGIFREEFDLKVDSTLFIEHPSVGSLRSFLRDLMQPKTPQPPVLTPPISPQMQSISMAATEQLSASSRTPDTFHVQSILLHGSQRTASRNLFLFPDGSGSCASYALLASHLNDICVWGMTCPFMTSPESFTTGVSAVVRKYMVEIRKRQSNGPYILGGWSAGGVLAYEATKQLLDEGDSVDQLLLIDSPFPLGLEALPLAFHEFCADIGLLNVEGRLPHWLLPHFAATVRELTKYSDELVATSLKADMIDKMPRTVIIWARDGVEKDSKKTLEWKGRMPNSMHWLMEDRSDMGPNGWERLLGSAKIDCLSVDANHFTMMRAAAVVEVGRLLDQEIWK
ncbi:Thiolase-like protein [Glarea lozoyensis ATCC 20868]|uniref:Thiolase-like protein n=1 Tax=Glarea lozoyensis (strain ATCC 20868 / MF5171) TaxID=1116229 RepID=S3D9A7_GLAL2|nr:Thiolase-like protein [Glarea lozoyensis ATCC 20868]EPE33704.1 Thiolase-like protein [Glarea lozoyensis ATCC 20868]